MTMLDRRENSSTEVELKEETRRKRKEKDAYSRR